MVFEGEVLVKPVFKSEGSAVCLHRQCATADVLDKIASTFHTHTSHISTPIRDEQAQTERSNTSHSHGLRTDVLAALQRVGSVEDEAETLWILQAQCNQTHAFATYNERRSKAHCL